MAMESFSRMMDRIARTPPLLAFAATAVPGVGLAVLSYVLNLNEVACPGGLTLGYAFELNWIWNFALAVPCATAAVFVTIGSTREAIASLVGARMLINRDGTAVGELEANGSWQKVFTSYMRVALVTAALGFAESYWEWAHLVLSRNGGRCGWFTAAALDPHVSRTANLIFGLLAFSLQGLGISIFLLFFFTVIAFCVWVYRFTSDAEPVEILPDTTSDDGRLGFQAFEPFVVNMLYAGLAYFGVFFLTRLHFLFIAQTQIKTAYEFTASEALFGLVTDLSNLAKGSGARLLSIGSITALSPMVCALGLLIMVALSVLVPILVLLQAAERSRSRNQVFLNNGDPRAMGLGRPEVSKQKARLASMTSWPLKYPRPVALVVFAFTAAVTFFFYRLTFVLAAGFAVASFRAVRKVLRNADAAAQPPAAAPPPDQGGRAPGGRAVDRV